MKVIFTLAIAFIIGIGVVAAQTPVVKSINGGVLNGKATSLPTPVYPEGVRLAGIGGTVAVDVVIDENGQVISAVADPVNQRKAYDANGAAMETPPLDAALRQAAENAAWLAKFSPTLLSGMPVRVSGRVVYNFVAKGEGLVVESARPAMDPLPTGPVINSEATSMPPPAYPAAARAVKADGTVVVRVEIDTDGNVTSAAVISGHPLLRSAAQQAAKEAKFKPAEAGRSGVVVYNFQLSAPPQ